jgi:hypothetical protein
LLRPCINRGTVYVVFFPTEHYRVVMGVAPILLSLALVGADPAIVATDAVPAVEPVKTLGVDEAASTNTALLPALSIVEIEIAEPLNSKTSKIGQFFSIKLSAPIILDGKELIPAGAMGKGEVIHAAKARAMGKAGELTLAARYIEHNGQRIALRSFQFGVSNTGKNNTKEALALGTVAVPLVLFVSGGNVDVPAGTAANAKTATDNVFTINGGQNNAEE